MHILLLPPTLPPQRSLSPDHPRVSLTPGQRVTATVLSPDLEGRSMLAFAGRELASRTPLPFAPGSTVLLEVVTVEDDVPQLRVVPQETPAPGPPVAAGAYGYAAAVLAAKGDDVGPASAAVLRWVPLFVARGLLTPRQAERLTGALGPVVLPRLIPAAGSAEPGPMGPTDAGLAELAESLAEALAERVRTDPATLEARVAQALRRQDADGAERAVARDVRTRLAALLAQLPSGTDAADDLDGAREALAHLQEALLGEQARAAALHGRDGVLVLRVPLAVGDEPCEVQLRVSDAPEEQRDDPSAAGGHRVRIDVDFASLGRVQAHVLLSGGAVRVELLTAEPGAADLLEEHLDGLRTALGAAGFSEVLTRVAIDPVRVTTEAPLDLPPEGSIVNADA